jgi:hypothetical protein
MLINSAQDLAYAANVDMRSAEPNASGNIETARVSQRSRGDLMWRSQ